MPIHNIYPASSLEKINHCKNWFSYVPNSLQAAFLKCHSLCRVWGGWRPAALPRDFHQGEPLNWETSTPDPRLPSYSVVICTPQLNTSNLQAARFHGCLTLEKHIPATNTKSCCQQQTPYLQLFPFSSQSAGSRIRARSLLLAQHVCSTQGDAPRALSVVLQS